MNSIAQEAQVLESIVPKLEADGYSVYLHPSPDLLPPFMKNYVPDAIALGRPKNLAIEVVSETAPSTTKIEKVREFFRDVEDWEFRVYYIRPASAQDVVEAMPRTAIEDSLRTIEGLLSREQLQPAVLISWATFEALGRALLPQKLTRPQAPRQLVETLASDGFVTPSEADVARRIADERNRIAHGDLQLGVERAEICQFIAILNTLLGLVPASR